MELSEFYKVTQDALARVDKACRRIAKSVQRAVEAVNAGLSEYREYEERRAKEALGIKSPSKTLEKWLAVDLSSAVDMWGGGLYALTVAGCAPQRINLRKYVIPPLPASASDVDRLRWCWAWGWAKKHRPKLVHRYLAAKKWRVRNKYKNMILREYLQGGYKDGYAGKAGR